MTESQKQAQETRKKNLEARTAKYKEQADAIRAARAALQKVLEREDTTTEQALEAAKLLADLGKQY